MSTRMLAHLLRQHTVSTVPPFSDVRGIRAAVAKTVLGQTKNLFKREESVPRICWWSTPAWGYHRPEGGRSQMRLEAVDGDLFLPVADAQAEGFRPSTKNQVRAGVGQRKGAGGSPSSYVDMGSGTQGLGGSTGGR